MTSILDTIKKALGLATDDTTFDVDIIMNINSVLMTLNQIGVGTDTCYSITDKDNTWSQFLGTATNLEAVKSYMYLKVRLLFDPPTNSIMFDSMNRQITEFEWRLQMQAEKYLPIPSSGEEIQNAD